MNATPGVDQFRAEKNTIPQMPQGWDRPFRDVVKATDECIAQHPWSAVGFAMAAGVLAGILFASCRRSNCCEE